MEFDGWIQWNKKLDADGKTPDIHNDALIEYKQFNGGIGRLEFGNIDYRAWGDTGNRIIAYRIIDEPEEKKEPQKQTLLEYAMQSPLKLTYREDAIVVIISEYLEQCK